MDTPSTPPKLSLVAPTMGNKDNILTMLSSIVKNAPLAFMKKIELVVFVNFSPNTKANITPIETYINDNGHLFHSTKIIVADKYYMTAEESACAAISHATGKFLWISGDKRQFLTEGLTQLAEYINAPPTSCAYFNSIWYDAQGITHGFASTYFSQNITTVPYKLFVQTNGINYIATNMGTWIYARKHMDKACWTKIITECGPHFSHVTTLLESLQNTEITCYSTFLSIIEEKAYHTGNDNEWDHYAKTAGTYRYYAWTFGLVRQFKRLMNSGVYSCRDIRSSMCSERQILARQIDEVYRPFVSQIWLGWLNPKEQITRNEFNELIDFLIQICPERSRINSLLKKLYDKSLEKKSSGFISDAYDLRTAISADQKMPRLGSLIIGQIGDNYIRLHPKGYLVSKASDNEQFLMAYKLISSNLQGPSWHIVGESEFQSLEITSNPSEIDMLYPDLSIKLLSSTRLPSLRKKLIPNKLIFTCLNLLPRWMISYLWKKRL